MSRAPSMPAAMPNLAHTTQLRNKSAMHSHATMMGAVTTRRLIQLCQKSRIRLDCTISRQPPFSHYICNPSLFKRLSPSASFSQEEHKRFGGLDEISPIDCHLHLEQYTACNLPQNRGFPFHQCAR